MFSLSDPNNAEYSGSRSHEHDLSCKECFRLACTCDEINSKLADENVPLTEEQRARLQYDSNQATNAIHLWKAHPLHTIIQEKGKQDILVNLDRASTLIIMGHEVSGHEVS